MAEPHVVLTGRKRPYWRVSPAFWTDEKTVEWNQDTRYLALYILTCPHRTLEGLFRLSKGYILDDLGWDAERLREPFQILLSDGFIEYDGRARLCLIVNALAYQAPDNSNHAKAAVKQLATLPKSGLFARLLQLADIHSKPLADALRKGLPERFGDGNANPPTPTPTPTPDKHIPYGVAKIATEHVDDFADIDFGEEDESEPEPPRKPSPPSRPRSASPRTKKNAGAPPENAGVLVAYLVDHAKTRGFALTEDLKGRYARSIGQVLKTGADPPLIRQAIEQCLARNKDPTHLVFVVNDLKGGSKHETGRRSGRSENGEW